MAIRLLAAALLVGMLAEWGLAAEPTRAPTIKPRPGPPRVSVTLLSETASVEPGASFWVGLRQRIAPGWHTYWTNPGDSGEPPTVEWALPPGWAAGPLVFPQPERVPVGPLMSFGYTREVVLLTRLTAPPDLPMGLPVSLRAHAAWLVCELICIP
jgi:thiol:disulfide interchange protein DsbD